MQTPSEAASRRRFLKLTGGAVALIPLVNLYGCGDGDAGRPMPEPEPGTQPDQAPPATPDTQGSAPGQSPNAQGSPQSQPAQQPAAQSAGGDLERLEESDSIAQSLNYKHSAEEVEHPLYEPGETCANCLQYQPELSDDEQWGGCRVIPGKLVNADGWCQVWAAQQA